MVIIVCFQKALMFTDQNLTIAKQLNHVAENIFKNIRNSAVLLLWHLSNFPLKELKVCTVGMRE